MMRSRCKPWGYSLCTGAPSPDLSSILFEGRERLYTGYGGGTGLYVARGSAKKEYLFRFRIYERVGVSLVEVYERVGKSVI